MTVERAKVGEHFSPANNDWATEIDLQEKHNDGTYKAYYVDEPSTEYDGTFVYLIGDSVGYHKPVVARMVARKEVEVEDGLIFSNTKVTPLYTQTANELLVMQKTRDDVNNNIESLSHIKDCFDHIGRTLDNHTDAIFDLQDRSEEGESEFDPDYLDLEEKNVSDIKEIAKLNDHEFDYERMLRVEKLCKDRKTLVSWLEDRVEGE